MERIEQHYKSLQRRMLLSIAVFVLFALWGILAAVQKTIRDDATLLPLMVLFITSIVILPRSAIPRPWPQGETPEEQDGLQILRGELQAFQTRATWVRLFYFMGVALIAALTMIGI